MRSKLLLIIVIALFAMSFKSDKPAYRIFSFDGKSVKYAKMIDDIAQADVVFFGELHDNPIAHWLEFEITKDLYERNGEKLILGAEMFEADNQLILNEYLEGRIPDKSFEKEARIWPNYKTDYKPLVDFAKDHKLDFIATNVPRRYASVAYKMGIDTLLTFSAEAQSYMAPLPIEYDSTLNCYAEIMKSMSGMGHANPNLPKSQALKDATMAYYIAGNYQSGDNFLHYNGSYHSNDKESIIWYLNKYQPGLRIVTINTVEQSQLEELNEDFLNSADFVIVVDEDMTKTQ